MVIDMSLAKIQKGDKVKVIAGNYKGTIGIVSKVVRKKLPGGRVRVRVAVSTIPTITDYRRGLKMYNLPGQIKSKERLIDVSNVQLITEDGQVSRVAIAIDNGRKVRILKKTGQVVVKASSLETEVNTNSNVANQTS
jgi:large subunit ribosomal protein L24